MPKTIRSRVPSRLQLERSFSRSSSLNAFHGRYRGRVSKTISAWFSLWAINFILTMRPTSFFLFLISLSPCCLRRCDLFLATNFSAINYKEIFFIPPPPSRLFRWKNIVNRYPSVPPPRPFKQHDRSVIKLHTELIFLSHYARVELSPYLWDVYFSFGVWYSSAAPANPTPDPLPPFGREMRLK